MGEFANDRVRLVEHCHKPDRKEFSKVAVRTATGFTVMGFWCFLVNLVFIPMKNIIVGCKEILFHRNYYLKCRKVVHASFGDSDWFVRVGLGLELLCTKPVVALLEKNVDEQGKKATKAGGFSDNCTLVVGGCCHTKSFSGGGAHTRIQMC